jgi:hypothetical protein
MTDPDERPTREDALYASMFALLGRIGFFLAVAIPVLVASSVATDGAYVPLIAAIWLGEAIIYTAVRRRRGSGLSNRALILAVVAVGVLLGLGMWKLSTTLP